MRGLKDQKEKVAMQASQAQATVTHNLKMEGTLSTRIEDCDAKNKALRESLGRAMAKLNTVKTAMSQFQADAHQNQNVAQQDRISKCPELQEALNKVDKLVEQQLRLREETQNMTLATLRTQVELNNQRSQCMSLESFVRKVSTVGQGYVLEKAAKKQAEKLLREAHKMREADDAELGEQ